MKRHLVVICTIVSCLFLFVASSAADSFTLNYVDMATGGSVVDAMAYMQATSDGGGIYTVTSISGYYNGQAITGLVPLSGPGSDTADYLYDNLLMYPSSSGTLAFDADGVLFSVAGGIGNVNLCGNPGCSLDNTSAPYTSITGGQTTGYVFTDVTPFIAPAPPVSPMDSGPVSGINTPEPATLVLMGTGLIGALGAFRRKRMA